MIVQIYKIKKLTFAGFIQMIMIAYLIIKTGYLNHDSSHLTSYDLELNNKTDCTFAPSIPDHWQNCGIEKAFFNFI